MRKKKACVVTFYNVDGTEKEKVYFECVKDALKSLGIEVTAYYQRLYTLRKNHGIPIYRTLTLKIEKV